MMTCKYYLNSTTNFQKWKGQWQRPTDSYVFGYAESESGVRIALRGQSYELSGVPNLGIFTIFYSSGAYLASCFCGQPTDVVITLRGGIHRYIIEKVCEVLAHMLVCQFWVDLAWEGSIWILGHCVQPL